MSISATIPRSRSTCTDLVPLGRDECPSCCSALDHHIWNEPALFIHGGYGATTTHRVRRCRNCRWSLPADQATVNPRH
jgi:hypothetical protein